MNFLRDQDVAFEESLIASPYNIKTWVRYISSTSEIYHQLYLYRRSLLYLPGSYKLWMGYLNLLIEEFSSSQRKFSSNFVISQYKQALILLNKMPMLWIHYLKHLKSRANVTQVRRTFNSALQSIPITQHNVLWKEMLPYFQQVKGETLICVYRRYLQYQPEAKDEYLDILLEEARFKQAIELLISMLEDNLGNSYQLWQRLTDILINHPDQIPSQLDVEAIINQGIYKFPQQQGKLYNSLARWWILKREFERARDVYEIGMQQVDTVKDFTMIFDAYIEFEESVISALMENGVEEEDEVDEYFASLQVNSKGIDLDLRLDRFEKLMERRPFLVNDVLLRQNPNSVHDWLSRVRLYSNPEDQVKTYSKAVSTINPKKATGSFGELWLDFAKFYYNQDDVVNGRAVMEKAVKVPYKKPDELADVWIAWTELEQDAQYVLGLLERATSPPRLPIPNHPDLTHANIRYNDDSIHPQFRMFKSTKLWAHYVDMEETLGTMESTKAVYDKMLQLKVATPQIIINYAQFLQEHQYFEESFKVYERGIDLFGYPIAFDIWNIYLAKFLVRFQGTKLERARDLFESALENVPAKFAKTLYLAYAKMEEDYGLMKNAMRIYDKATKAVEEEDLYEVFNLWISKASQHFGLVSTREIYQRAVEALPDAKAKDMALRFVDMEAKLGETERARAILGYASQLANPKTDGQFWKAWHDFEVKYGNEETFKEMLRIKRSVQAKFYNDIPSSAPTPGQPLSAMEALELEASKNLNFVKATVTGSSMQPK